MVEEGDSLRFLLLVSSCKYEREEVILFVRGRSVCGGVKPRILGRLSVWLESNSLLPRSPTGLLPTNQRSPTSPKRGKGDSTYLIFLAAGTQCGISDTVVIPLVVAPRIKSTLPGRTLLMEVGSNGAKSQLAHCTAYQPSIDLPPIK